MQRQPRSLQLTWLGGLLMATLTASAGSPAGALQGQWGGDQLRLVIDAQGGRIATACADGSFLVTGVYDQHQPGPQRADEDAAHAPARFSGEVRNGVMTLSILPAGAQQAQVFTLRQGQPAKIVRCL